MFLAQENDTISVCQSEKRLIELEPITKRVLVSAVACEKETVRVTEPGTAAVLELETARATDRAKDRQVRAKSPSHPHRNTALAVHQAQSFQPGSNSHRSY
jgi:hypothetical protein